MTGEFGQARHRARSSSGPLSESDGDLHKRRAASNSTLTLEEENDLRQFLKVVRGVEWSKPRRHGHSDINRVVEKLKAIGVADVSELLQRVTTRTINEDLSKAGYPRFSKDTLESIRKQSSFIRAMEHLNEANYRQVGVLAPAQQMLSGRNLRHQAAQSGAGLRSSLASVRPSSEPGTGERQSARRALPGDTGLARAGAQAEGPDACATLRLRGAQPRGRRRGQQPLRALAAPPGLDPMMPGPGAPASPASERGPSCCSPARSGNGADGLSSAAGDGASPARRSSAAGGSPARERLVSFRGLAPGADTPRVVERLLQASSQMCREPRAAHWTSLNHSSDSLLEHGEAMLREQAALEARTQLCRVMEGEGMVSPMRQYVTRNIRARLKEEKERDDQGTLDQVEIQQRSINIRKHLGLMSNLRRELQVLKRTAFEDEGDRHREVITFDSVFQRSKSHGQLEPLSGARGQTHATWPVLTSGARGPERYQQGGHSSPGGR